LVAKIWKWLGAIGNAIKWFLTLVALGGLIIVGMGIRSCVADDTTIRGYDSLSVKLLVGDYEKRLKESRDGLAWYKGLYERRAVAVVTKIERFPFALRGETMWLTPDSVFTDIEIPFFVRKNEDSLRVLTFYKPTNTISSYAFGDLGRNFDIMLDPGAPVGKAISLITSRDWVIFNGFGIGAGMRYNLIAPPFPFVDVKARLTLFQLFELEANVSPFPSEVRVEAHYFFR